MLVRLEDGETWDYEVEGAFSEIAFASASSDAEAAWLSAYLNGKEVECVCLKAPHSWWSATNQSLFRVNRLGTGDKVRLKAKGGFVVVRLDFDEH